MHGKGHADSARTTCFHVVVSGMSTQSQTAQASGSHELKAEDPEFRLDKTVLPSFYDLYFEPHPTGLIRRAESSAETDLDLGDSMSSVNSMAAVSTAKPFVYGIAKIRVSSSTNIRALTLHALNLDIKSVHWYSQEQGEEEAAPVESFSFNAAHETIRIEIGQPIAANREIVIAIRYNARIEDASAGAGLFFSHNGDPWFLATQLEPTQARRLFPCFDEPTFKAKFRISVRFPEAYTCLGPTPIESIKMFDVASTTPVSLSTLALAAQLQAKEESGSRSASAQDDSNTNSPQHRHKDPEDESPTAPFNKSPPNAESSPLTGATSELDTGSFAIARNGSGKNLPSSTTKSEANAAAANRFKIIVFETTPIISTYIVAFVIGKLHSSGELRTKSGISCRVWVPETESAANGSFAQELLKNALEFFEGFFSFPLPVQKIDVVALDEFRMLGMENWGLITLLKDYCVVSENTPIVRRQRIARLIGHEVVHQWFGNLVSLEWWDAVWLKEGLARYMEYVFCHEHFRNWNIWSNFLADIENVSIKGDFNAKESVEIQRPLHPRRVFDHFNITTYGKAASIVRMITSVVGEGGMNAALRAFVQKYNFAHAKSIDLITCIKEQAQKSTACQGMVANAGGKIGIDAIMLNWIRTPKHPFIFIIEDPESESDGSPLQAEGGHTSGPKINIYQFECPNYEWGFLVHLDELRQVSPRPLETEAAPAQNPPSTRGKKPRSVTVNPFTLLQASRFLIPIKIDQLHSGQVVESTFVLAHEPMTCFTTSLYQPPPVTDSASVLNSEQQSPDTPFVPAEPREDEPATAEVRPPAAVKFVNPPQQESQPLTIIANPGSAAVCRTDYSASLWLKVLDVIMEQSPQDRLAVCMNLFELRSILVGVCKRTDPVDRCVLPLRLLYELGAKRESHSVVISYAIDYIEKLYFLILEQPCWSEVRELLKFSLRGMTLRGAPLSFFSPPKEAVLDFQASRDLSRQTCAKALRTMAVCGDQETIDAATRFVKWVGAAWCRTPDRDENAAKPTLGGSMENTAPPVSYYISCCEEDLTRPCVLNSLDFDFVSVAFVSAMKQNADLTLWFAVTQMYAFCLGDSKRFYPKAGVYAQLPDLAIQTDLVIEDTAAWAKALLPAILVSPIAQAQELQLEILSDMTDRLDQDALMALFRNERFLHRFVEQATQADHHHLVSIATFAASYGSNEMLPDLLCGKMPRFSKEVLLRNAWWADYVSDHFTWYIGYTLLKSHERTLRMLSTGESGVDQAQSRAAHSRSPTDDQCSI